MIGLEWSVTAKGAVAAAVDDAGCSGIAVVAGDLGD
jgi:hypothetical protein